MKKKVVIVGGGFAGSIIAKKLQDNFDVTLIDSKEYFEFVPGILRALVEPEHLDKIQILHRAYLKKSRIIFGEAKSIGSNFISVNGKEINFDYLVLSSGSRYNLPIKMYNVFKLGRTKNLYRYHKKLKDSKKVLIVGGGITGVELAAEIATKYSKEIFLVHSNKRLIDKLPMRASAYTEKFLLDRGVKLFLNERFLEGNKFFRTGKRKLNADVAFLCTGISPNSSYLKGFEKDREFIKVNEFLQVYGRENIFSAGDLVSIKEDKTAQNAEKHANIVVKNINLLERGKKLKEYYSRPRIMVISLGKYDGIVVYRNFSFFGVIPGILKGIIEKFGMLKRKI